MREGVGGRASRLKFSAGTRKRALQRGPFVSQAPRSRLGTIERVVLGRQESLRSGESRFVRGQFFLQCCASSSARCDLFTKSSEGRFVRRGSSLVSVVQ